MSQNFEKSVKGATKIKLAAPKSKYIEHILVATHTGEAGVAEIFRTLQHRLRDSTWTIVFKALIVMHLMVREGELNATLQHMAENPKKLAISGFSEVQSQGHNIRRYSDYLISRSRAFAETQTDYVRSGQGRLKRLTVDKGLLRETEIVQKQIKALLRCDLLTDEVENEITLTAFRLLTLDLLTLYSVMNEGTINVLEHYFEMSRPDSERALAIYKTFTTQTEEVVKFLGVARHFEAATRLEIPKLKHASTDLTRLLEDDLNDPDFDLRRREYQVQKGARKAGHVPAATSSSSSAANATASKAASNSSQAVPKSEPKADLIDFFESIEQSQQPIPQQSPFQQAPGMPFPAGGFQQPQQPGFYPQPQQPQPTGFDQAGFPGSFAPQSATNPFGQPSAQAAMPLQPQSTGAGFGGYGPQPHSYQFQSSLAPIPQNGVASFPQQPQLQSSPPQLQPPQQQQTTNPFRQSMLMSTPTGGAAPAAPLTRQNTNPFARRLSNATPSFNPGPSLSSPSEAFSSPGQQPAVAAPPPAPLQAQRTGTNPFSRGPQPGLQPPPAAPLQPNVTGTTNPFRQSAFINQQTGQGWHLGGQQGTMGGLEQLDTVPVFPRPGMA
ncbi:hypothetical protein ASPZODRAFT_131847 [Penicilliopsis zonata CBS 506.65]|uniref:ENTH domain-containing protein n=1 Tax=Penicilliopsis zonata CBS 506.65 TaxID=1073090 RepID=A0A1L9SI94_9EURO|nr:hypothetical protein ASPZODRAFT_131847 [Penicilliopsis zonata CBS 506.65]OJJ46935.1 hypothetical protein ASPZODRAFT_131847 [Penicilliopsis zonata CBS 506.65]